jgi:phosphonate transport system substrate-binding protein
MIGPMTSPAAPARDDFRVAIATTRSPLLVLPLLTSVCKALRERFGRACSGHLMIAYDELVRGAEGDEFDLMWLPPLIALSVVGRGEATPIAVPVREGLTSYATALFTRPDRGIERLEDLAGKTVAWVDEHSCAGYVLPRALLRKRGLDPDAILGEQQLLRSYDEVVAAVLGGRVDAGAAYVHVVDGVIESAAWGEREVRVLAQHGPIPADLVACGRGLDPEARAALAALLLGEPEAELTRLARELMSCEAFVAPEPSHLAALAALVS